VEFVRQGVHPIRMAVASAPEAEGRTVTERNHFAQRVFVTGPDGAIGSWSARVATGVIVAR
jgi:hypothetical protein